MNQIIQELKDIKSTKKELKQFSIVIGIVFVLIGFYQFSFTNNSGFYSFSSGLLILIIGHLVPKVLLPFQKLWMIFSVIIGWIMSRVILTILFYFVMSPIGLFLRIMGKDILNKKLDTSSTTYWISKTKNTDINRYSKQF